MPAQYACQHSKVPYIIASGKTIYYILKHIGFVEQGLWTEYDYNKSWPNNADALKTPKSRGFALLHGKFEEEIIRVICTWAPTNKLPSADFKDIIKEIIDKDQTIFTTHI